MTLTFVKSTAQVPCRMSLIWGESCLGRGSRYRGRKYLRGDVSILLPQIKGYLTSVCLLAASANLHHLTKVVSAKVFSTYQKVFAFPLLILYSLEFSC